MEDIQDCCRICLDVETKHVSIFEDSLLPLQIKSCLPISVEESDKLPKTICESCVSQLNDFYNFQLNARCSDDWLQSSIQKSAKNTPEKSVIQPLPDSEYNSDSLLEFLNNTANIEEYLNNLGKEDIPCIVNMLDKTESSDPSRLNIKTKLPSPKKKTMSTMAMDIDILDSDKHIVKELLMKEPKKLKSDKLCYGCKTKFDNVAKLSKHIGTCDVAVRTCVQCNKVFDSKIKLEQHSTIHSNSSEKPSSLLRCVFLCKQCGETFGNHFELLKHAKQHVVKSYEKICDICTHTFMGDEALAKHRKEDHDKPAKILYRCKVCCYTTVDRRHMYLHVSRHAQVREPNRHLCETCGQSFATQATLLRHSQQHSKKGHQCKVCSKLFSNKQVHDNHLLEHTEMVMCEKCAESVPSSELSKHNCV
ncbi:zinc finger protein 354B-like [Aricia agestis]|uniref:zinc finger protein 354B-like n=1 Tax=Aricia agestis TaxID=91739 RepID=UPI001C209CB7|nr:zinc finger protein 354B-like [Aricia agestis]